MPSPAGYSRPQIALHWIVVLLIAQQYLFKDRIAAAWQAIGTGATSGFDPLVMAHVLGGALVLILTLWRLMLRARRGVPAEAPGSAVQRLIGRLTHLGLYALMILMPISGAAAWFGGVQVAAAGHNVLKIVLLLLIVLHVAGALFHQFVLRDGLLNRMRRAAD